MPILLLSRERVATEVMQLAKLKIAAALGVPADDVGARWEHEEGKAPTPVFDVDASKVEGMTEDEIHQSMGAIWRWLKNELRNRLDGVRQQRYG